MRVTWLHGLPHSGKGGQSRVASRFGGRELLCSVSEAMSANLRCRISKPVHGAIGGGRVVHAIPPHPHPPTLKRERAPVPTKSRIIINHSAARRSSSNALHSTTTTATHSCLYTCATARGQKGRRCTLAQSSSSSSSSSSSISNGCSSSSTGVRLNCCNTHALLHRPVGVNFQSSVEVVPSNSAGVLG